MKVYDKEMYKIENKVKNVFLIIAIFIISFLAGVFSRNAEIKAKDVQIQDQQNEINELKREINVLQEDV